jgi:hypothetical protein
VLFDGDLLNVQGKAERSSALKHPEAQSGPADALQEQGGLLSVEKSLLPSALGDIAVDHRETKEVVAPEPETTQQFAPGFKGLFVEPWEAYLNREIWSSGPEKGYGDLRNDATGYTYGNE